MDFVALFLIFLSIPVAIVFLLLFFFLVRRSGVDFMDARSGFWFGAFLAALLTATIVKVFGSDAGALEGVLRILSFFGLGIGLIGISLLYGPVLRAEAVSRKS